MYWLYRALTHIASPFVYKVLERRRARGKEEGARLPERLGNASLSRPYGTLVWIHAASVGESNSVLALIHALLARNADVSVLLTTVTVTSAALMGKHLPERALHQFGPVDTPRAVDAFLKHWQPDVGLFVDSELWPNLIVTARKQGVVLGLVNARMSERSFRRWRYALPFIGKILHCFSVCFAQSPEDAGRLKALGLPLVTGIGNLKYDAAALAYDENQLQRLRAAVKERPVLLAASTHPGEEEQIAHAHRSLAVQEKGLLTIIVPRHATRGKEIAEKLDGLHVAYRSRSEAITPKTDIYIADTMGELGLFYRLASIVFMGGTLVAHGGQNPLEPARLGRAIVTGPHMENFAAIATSMQKENAILRAADVVALTEMLKRLLGDADARAVLGANANAHVLSHEGISTAIIQTLQGFLGSDKTSPHARPDLLET